MIRSCLILFMALGLALPAAAQFGNLGKLADKAQGIVTGQTPLSQDEIGTALKEALDQGVGQAVTSLSAQDGYLASPYKILLPEEARTVVSRVSALPGFGNLERDLVERINRAAELAAKQAGPIFVDAIRGLTFKDALNLLMGEKDAATRYLETSTTTGLTGAFRPVIRDALDEVKANELYFQAVTAYNKIPLVKKTEPELDRYVTARALEGMFGLIEVKETELRENPALRNTELLRKVFARQDK
ncbi:DUF4197 domain-containing protein [Lewinella sp. JB7]|uniref:DUF4197 domain-containing protein n=1 Tax=Lewinella sp. JB7 TaxID=2962887 RepID=UPI0020CA1442|nr:DUF4197 domain-containing protein [Lewinella sp. JB7]MCP9237576.1 DUF4197 domain-containing protein [Lewinella sp. JB7]